VKNFGIFKVCPFRKQRVVSFDEYYITRVTYFLLFKKGIPDSRGRRLANKSDGIVSNQGQFGTRVYYPGC